MDEFDFFSDNNESEESSIDFDQIKNGLWKGKWIILILTFLGFGGVYFLVKDQQPVYSSYVMLQTREFTSGPGNIFSIDRQKEMRSTNFAQRVTAKMGYAVSLGENSQFSTRDDVFDEIYTTFDPEPGTYKILVDSLANFYFYKVEEFEDVLIDSATIFDVTDTTMTKTINGVTFRLKSDIIEPNLEITFKVKDFIYAAKSLMSNFDFWFDRIGKYMRIEMEGEDPDVIPKELNKIAQIYVDETKRLTNRDVIEADQSLQQNLKAANEGVQQTTQELVQFENKYPLSLDAQKEALSKELNDIEIELETIPIHNQQIEDLLLEIEKLDNTDENFDMRRVNVRSLANCQAMADEAKVINFRDQLELLETKYEGQIDELSKNASKTKETAAQIKSLHQKIVSFALDFKDELSEKEENNKIKLREIRAELKTLNSDKMRLEEIQRRRDTYLETKNSLDKRRANMLAGDMSGEATIKILDPAIRPTDPKGTNKKVKVLFGGGAGFIVGAGLSILLELLNRKVRTIKDVERHIKAPVIGAVPHVDFTDIPEHKDYEKIQLVGHQLGHKDYSGSPLAESYRGLRTKLLYSKQIGKIQSLAITSITPEEGKSFTASNLATIFARQKKRTLLIDGDLRRGVLHNTFKVQKQPGLSDCLEGGFSLSEIVQETYVPYLFMISCGKVLNNPSELLGGLNMRRVVEEARRKFDILIIDTPPLNAATDAVITSTLVDAVSVVIRANKTDRDDAKKRIEVFNTVPVNFIGVILNGVDSIVEQNYYGYQNY